MYFVKCWFSDAQHRFRVVYRGKDLRTEKNCTFFGGYSVSNPMGYPTLHPPIKCSGHFFFRGIKMDFSAPFDKNRC